MDLIFKNGQYVLIANVLFSTKQKAQINSLKLFEFKAYYIVSCLF